MDILTTILAIFRDTKNTRWTKYSYLFLPLSFFYRLENFVAWANQNSSCLYHTYLCPDYY